MHFSPLDQPFDLQVHSCIHKSVEMAICVFEAKSVRVYEVFY